MNIVIYLTYKKQNTSRLFYQPHVIINHK